MTDCSIVYFGFGSDVGNCKITPQKQESVTQIVIYYAVICGLVTEMRSNQTLLKATTSTLWTCKDRGKKILTIKMITHFI